MVRPPKAGKTRKIKISLTLDEDVLEWLEKASAHFDMSRSEYVNFILSGGLAGSELFDKVIDRLFDQKKDEMKSKLRALAKVK